MDNLFKVKTFTQDYKLSLESYPSLIYLSLINIGLVSLDNFPNLKFLEIVRKSNKIYLILFFVILVEFKQEQTKRK